jgi:hypothetical protein
MSTPVDSKASGPSYSSYARDRVACKPDLSNRLPLPDSVSNFHRHASWFHVDEQAALTVHAAPAKSVIFLFGKGFERFRHLHYEISREEIPEPSANHGGDRTQLPMHSIGRREASMFHGHERQFQLPLE